MERLSPDDTNIRLTMEHLESFAKDGLRTLCLGYRTLTREEYNVNFHIENERSTFFVCLSTDMARSIS